MLEAPKFSLGEGSNLAVAGGMMGHDVLGPERAPLGRGDTRSVLCEGCDAASGALRGSTLEAGPASLRTPPFPVVTMPLGTPCSLPGEFIVSSREAGSMELTGGPERGIMVRSDMNVLRGTEGVRWVRILV